MIVEYWTVVYRNPDGTLTLGRKWPSRADIKEMVMIAKLGEPGSIVPLYAIHVRMPLGELRQVA